MSVFIWCLSALSDLDWCFGSQLNRLHRGYLDNCLCWFSNAVHSWAQDSQQLWNSTDFILIINTMFWGGSAELAIRTVLKLFFLLSKCYRPCLQYEMLFTVIKWKYMFLFIFSLSSTFNNNIGIINLLSCLMGKDGLLNETLSLALILHHTFF